MRSNSPVPYPGVMDLANPVKAGTIIASASQGVSAVNSPVIYNPGYPGVRLFIDVTNVGAGPGTVTVKIQVLDPVSGNYADLPGATTAAINGVSTKILTVYPSVAETATDDISDPLGNMWRVVATVATNAVTFSVGAEYLA